MGYTTTGKWRNLANTDTVISEAVLAENNSTDIQKKKRKNMKHTKQQSTQLTSEYRTTTQKTEGLFCRGHRWKYKKRAIFSRYQSSPSLQMCCTTGDIHTWWQGTEARGQVLPRWPTGGSRSAIPSQTPSKAARSLRPYVFRGPRNFTPRHGISINATEFRGAAEITTGCGIPRKLVSFLRLITLELVSLSCTSLRLL